MRGGDPRFIRICTLIDNLFPACAGVIPFYAGSDKTLKTFPRMRGGDPTAIAKLQMALAFPPYTQG